MIKSLWVDKTFDELSVTLTSTKVHFKNESQIYFKFSPKPILFVSVPLESIVILSKGLFGRSWGPGIPI